MVFSRGIQAITVLTVLRQFKLGPTVLVQVDKARYGIPSTLEDPLVHLVRVSSKEDVLGTNKTSTISNALRWSYSICLYSVARFNPEKLHRRFTKYSGTLFSIYDCRSRNRDN